MPQLRKAMLVKRNCPLAFVIFEAFFAFSFLSTFQLQSLAYRIFPAGCQAQFIFAEIKNAREFCPYSNGREKVAIYYNSDFSLKHFFFLAFGNLLGERTNRRFSVAFHLFTDSTTRFWRIIPFRLIVFHRYRLGSVAAFYIGFAKLGQDIRASAKYL